MSLCIIKPSLQSLLKFTAISTYDLIAILLLLLFITLHRSVLAYGGALEPQA